MVSQSEERQTVDTMCEHDFSVEQIGESCIPSPLRNIDYTYDRERISYFQETEAIQAALAKYSYVPAFEKAGPREHIFFDPQWTKVGIVTCGGLCPGINDVIKALVNTLHYAYGVKKIYGIPYGYAGLIPSYGFEPIPLNEEMVDTIHEKGGSILGSSRGRQEPEEIVQTLDRFGINVLFTVGGDGTQRGALEVARVAREKGVRISVIGIPKTIDNDLACMERTFGFETAVYTADPIITSAHNEAKGAYNGIGLVKLMGRHSGFIAASATLANSYVNFCLIPEVPFCMEGKNALLAAVERRLEKKNHAVIVVAEGAGQDVVPGSAQKTDASGNMKLQDIGVFLKETLEEHLSEQDIPHTVKYFDPSYTIRSVAAHGDDAIYCVHLARHAVHAAMAGKTAMVVGYWHNAFVNVPMRLAVSERKQVNPRGQFWQSVLNITRQEEYFGNNRSS